MTHSEVLSCLAAATSQGLFGSDQGVFRERRDAFQKFQATVAMIIEISNNRYTVDSGDSHSRSAAHVRKL